MSLCAHRLTRLLIMCKVSGPDQAQPLSLTLAALRALPAASVTMSMQCGGNRRHELNSVRPTSGNAWGLGAISTATFKGVWLRDVLEAAGVATAAQLGVLDRLEPCGRLSAAVV